jgi:hypothetical protein
MKAAWGLLLVICGSCAAVGLGGLALCLAGRGTVGQHAPASAGRERRGDPGLLEALGSILDLLS